MKKTKLYLFWFRYEKGKGNFGDELNPYLIERLSTRKVLYKNPYVLLDDKFLALKIFIAGILRGRKRNTKTLFSEFFDSIIFRPTILMGIGSILKECPYTNLNVWGSGMIARNRKVNRRKFYAVRGKITRELLIKQGHSVPEIYGDPALLLPLVFIPEVQIKYKFGIIPHYDHYGLLKNQFDEDILVIDLLADIETIIKQINSCTITLSTSLHGIIVSHAYDIPSFWVTFPQNENVKLVGDGMKFEDYFSSVNIESYAPVQLTKQKEFDYILGNSGITGLPERKILDTVRVNLLKSAPFPLKEEFLKNIK